MKKSEVLTRDEADAASPPRSWSNGELIACETRGAAAPETSTTAVGRASLAITPAMTVLGINISFNPNQPEALPARTTEQSVAQVSDAVVRRRGVADIAVWYGNGAYHYDHVTESGCHTANSGWAPSA